MEVPPHPWPNGTLVLWGDRRYRVLSARKTTKEIQKERNGTWYYALAYADTPHLQTAATHDTHLIWLFDAEEEYARLRAEDP